ncbi:hypothetical protein [Amphritea sp. HPY]|uniref:hypothetical protein n=1 Tax=Amphritea sp. HPY TaxID=3421652 RepID=UPI003D7DA81B
MPDMFLEIVELDDGEIALRKADSDDEPIMRVNFSDHILEQLHEQHIDVAKVMLTAGIHMISDINQKSEEGQASDGSSDNTDDLRPKVIH